MKYAFILGRVYTLSVAEVVEVLQSINPSLGLNGQPINVLDSSEEVLVIETAEKLSVEKLQKHLGGIVKILQVVDELEKRKTDSINFPLKNYFKPSTLKKDFFKDYKGKFQFGVSLYLLDMDLAKPQPPPSKPINGKPAYVTNIFSEPKRIGMMIKNTLTDSGMSIRLVLPEMRSLALASVSVTKNLLLQKGGEICILAAKEKIYTAKTITVQDFEDYGRRDYQRPVRDEKQGMIPPKVAQIMLNLSSARPGQAVLDPFCGIGTIVQEGLLLGFRMLGSDINKFAIKGSQQNLEWFRNRYKIAPGKYSLETVDATSGLSKLIQDSGQEISAIVTESTLGPVYSEFPKPQDIEKNFQDLKDLYTKAFIEFSKFLKPGSRIVMCIPAYRRGRDSYINFPSLDWSNDLGYNVRELIPAAVAKRMKFLKLTDRKTAIYDRKDQVVARELVIFEKI